jgi:flagellar biosynthesis protein FlhG
MQIWAVGGGKGGTGKSLVANGLGLRLAERGHKTILVDADFGGANQHTYCGIRNPGKNLGHFFENKALLDEILAETKVPGLWLIPCNLNSANTDGLNSAQKLKFFRHIKKLQADHVILDLGAGTSYDTLDAFLLADIQVCVLAPDALSVENFYLFVKNLQHRQLGQVLSRVGLREQAKDIWKNRAEHKIVTVLDLAAHLGRLSEAFREDMQREEQRLRLHLVLNQVHDYVQVEMGPVTTSMVRKFFRITTDFVGHIHYDKELWHQFGPGGLPIQRGGSFSLKQDLEMILHGILRTEGMVL